MNTDDLKSTRAAHAELLTRRGKFDQKKRDCESMAANISTKLSGLEQAHSILEKRYLTDEVSLAQVTASRQEIDMKRAELGEAERLAGLAAEAILEIDQQISAAAQAFRNARMAYCFQVRDAKLATIKQNQQFKELLLAAMAANSSNGQLMHSFHVTTFVELFISQILPEISEDEARAATEKFTTTNDLEI